MVHRRCCLLEALLMKGVVKGAFILLVFTMLVAAPAQAETVTANVTGQVVSNGIGNPPLSGVNSGDSVALSFTVDSNNFVDGIPGDTRGYVIDQSSFSLTFASLLTLGLQDPFPGGQTPYFTLVDGNPVSDGFFVSTSPAAPGGVPLVQEPYPLNLNLGYTGDTLDSLDILDAIGVYGFGGLTSSNFNLWLLFPGNVSMEMDFGQMTITPEPATFALLLVGGLAVLRRKRAT